MRVRAPHGPSSLHTPATLACVASTLLLLSELLQRTYTPNLAQYQRRAAYIINYFVGIPAIPEPTEQLQYKLLLPATIIFLCLFAHAFRWLVPEPRRSGGLWQWLLHTPSWLLGGPFLVLFALECRRTGYLYVQSWFPARCSASVCLLGLPLLVWLYWKRNAQAWNWAARFIRPVVVCVVIGVALSNSLYTSYALPPLSHFTPILFPIAVVRSGMEIGNDVLSLYGFFPVYVAPVASLFGGSVTAVCLVFGAAIALTYIALIYTTKWVTRGPWLRLCLTCALPQMSYLGFRGFVSEPYYQYWPIRMLFPALVLTALARTVRASRHQGRWLALAGALATTGLFWNLDSGAACMLAVGTFAVAQIPSVHRESQDTLFGAIRPIVHSLVVPILWGVLLATGLFCGLFRVQVGSWPNVPRAIANIQLLADIGYSFLPMPAGLATWHFWAITLALCALFAFPLFWSSRTRLASFQMAVSVMGFAQLVYYFGRSHELTLLGPIWLAPLVIGLIADRLEERLQGARLYAFGRLAQLTAMAILASGPIMLAMDLSAMVETGKARVAAWAQQRDGKSPRDAAARFIKNESRNRHRATIFVTYEDGPLLFLSGVRPAFEISSSTDFLFQAENARIVGALRRNRADPVFVAAQGVACPSREVMATLAELYDPITEGSGLVLLKRKQ